MRYMPGVIWGGASLEHDCGTGRAIGYFLEPLVLLALFAKKARRRGARAARARAQPPPRGLACRLLTAPRGAARARRRSR